MIQLGDRMYEVVGVQRIGDKARVYMPGGHFDDIPWKPYGQALWDQLVTTADSTVQEKVDAAAKGSNTTAVNTTT